MSAITPWPHDWPIYKQACYYGWQNRCDMLDGPCACGAWHQPGEFTLVDGVLHRYGEPVESLPNPYPSFLPTETSC